MGLERFKQYPVQFSSAFKRFPIVIGFFAVFMLFNILLTFLNFYDYDNALTFIEEHNLIPIGEAYPLWAAFLAIGLRLYQESGRKIPIAVSAILHVALFIVSVTLLPTLFDQFSDHYRLGLFRFPHFIVATSITLVSCSFLIPTFLSKNDFSLWRFLGKFTVSLITALLVTAAFYLTTSLLTLCITQLFDIEVFPTFGWICYSELCGFLIAPFLFLAGLPTIDSSENPPTLGKLLSSVVHYMFIPALLAYIVILYIYCISALVLGKMQCDVFSITIAVAATLSILFYNILSPAQHQPSKSFDKILLKIFPIAVIPLLVLMTAVIFSRIHQAGLTLTRYYVVSANVWYYTVFIIFLQKKISKKIWWTFATFSIATLITCTVPDHIFEETRLPKHEDISIKKSDNDINDSTEVEIPLQANSSTKLVGTIGSHCKNNFCRENASRHMSYKAKSSEVTGIPADFKNIQFFDKISFNKEQLKIENDTIFIQLKYGNDSTANFTIPSDIFITELPEKDQEPLVLKSKNATLLVTDCILAFYPYSEMSTINMSKALLFTK